MGRRSFVVAVVEDLVSDAWVEAELEPVPRAGAIRRVTATIDPERDERASRGDENADDIAVQIRETTGAEGLGATDNRGNFTLGGLILEYGLTPADPALTIDSLEELGFQAEADSPRRATGRGRLFVAVKVSAGDADTGNKAVAVVRVEIEED